MPDPSRPVSTAEPRYRSADHRLIAAIAWHPERPAEWVNDHILLSRSTSSSYLVVTDDGDLVINTGTAYQGDRHRERYEQLLGRSLDVRKIVITQSHPDHMSGWGSFAGPGVETIAERQFPHIWRERDMLAQFFQPRAMRVIHGLLPRPEHTAAWYGEMRAPDALTLFDGEYAFEQGGRRFQLLAVPSGETLDSCLVWLPDERTLFTGNMMGALYGAFPNFFAARGDRDRSVPQFLRDIERILQLHPALLLTGHDDPIVGEERIQADLTHLRDAVRYVHDATIAGMNAQKSLATLMAEIKLPAELEPAPGRSPISWYVRAVWEEYAGWFRQESTTELYAEPARSIWPELARLSGGADVLVEAADRQVRAGKPVEALHFLDIALASAPSHPAARAVEIQALLLLIERTGGTTYDELGWLEHKLDEARAALAAAASLRCRAP